MTIASGGTLGTGANSTSNSSYSLTTATNTLAAGDFAILVNVTDNTSTTDGNNNEHTSVSGGTGNWTKLGEYTNSPTGAAADGSTVSLWLFEVTGTVNTGTSITMNYASSRTDKASAFWKFTKLSGKGIRLDTEPGTNPITSEVNGSVGFGSSAFSGLSSKSRLYLRGCGKEANSTTTLTVSTNFTELTGTRSRNNSAAQIVRGEFRINTSTGETSNPTLTVTGDTAGLFVALIEVDPAPSDGSVAYSGNAPTVSLGKLITPSDGFVQLTTPATSNTTITPSAGSVAYTGNAPTLSATANYVIAPTTGTVTYTGAAPSLALKITPTVGSVSYSGNAPTVTTSANTAITPTVGSVAYSGNAPRLALTIPPATGTVALTGNAPTVTFNASIAPTTGTIAYTGNAPALNLSVQAAAGTVTITGYAPTVTVSSASSIAPSTGTVSLTGYAPAVSLQLNVTITPPAGFVMLTTYGLSPQVQPSVGTLTLTGYAPAVTVPFSISPTTGALTLTGYAPSVTVGASYTITPSSGSLTFTGYVSPQTYTLPSPATASLALTGYAPTVTRTSGTSIQPSAGTILLTGSGPALAYSLTVPVGVLTITGYAPSVTITISGVIVPTTGAVSLSGFSPTVTTSAFSTIQPTTETVSFTGNAPSLSLTIQPSSGTITYTGSGPSLASGLPPASGALALTGYAPSVTSPLMIQPDAADLTIIGYAPTVPSTSVQTRPPGGSGYPVNWQGKRRKARLVERPNLHLRAILDDVVRELYGELTEDDVPAEVQKQAAKIVKPFAEKKAKKLAVPPESAVDWDALEKDAARVKRIIALWREQETRREIDDDDEFMLLID